MKLLNMQRGIHLHDSPDPAAGMTPAVDVRGPGTSRFVGPSGAFAPPVVAPKGQSGRGRPTGPPSHSSESPASRPATNPPHHHVPAPRPHRVQPQRPVDPASCDGTRGYRFCESTGQCFRPWETVCHPGAPGSAIRQPEYVPSIPPGPFVDGGSTACAFGSPSYCASVDTTDPSLPYFTSPVAPGALLDWALAGRGVPGTVGISLHPLSVEGSGSSFGSPTIGGSDEWLKGVTAPQLDSYGCDLEAGQAYCHSTGRCAPRGSCAARAPARSLPTGLDKDDPLVPQGPYVPPIADGKSLYDAAPASVCDCGSPFACSQAQVGILKGAQSAVQDSALDQYVRASLAPLSISGSEYSRARVRVLGL